MTGVAVLACRYAFKKTKAMMRWACLRLADAFQVGLLFTTLLFTTLLFTTNQFY